MTTFPWETTNDISTVFQKGLKRLEIVYIDTVDRIKKVAQKIPPLYSEISEWDRSKTTTYPEINADGSEWNRLETTTFPEVKADGEDWVNKTWPRLIKIANLSPNWDGYGSPETDPALIRAAILLLSQLQGTVKSNLPAPFVCPIAGGGIQFEWTSSKKHLELEFLDENKIAFLKEETNLETENMVSGEYPSTNIDTTRQLLDWFTNSWG